MDPYFDFNIHECHLKSQKPTRLFGGRLEWNGLSLSPDGLTEYFYFASRKAVSAEECKRLSEKWEYADMFNPVKELFQDWDPEDSHRMYLFALRVNLELLDGRIPRDSIKVQVIRKINRGWKAGITSETIDSRTSKGFGYKIEVNIYEIDEPDRKKRLLSYFGDLLHHLVNVLFCYYCCKCINCQEVSYKFDNRGITGHGLPWQVIARIVETLAKERMDIDVDLKRSVAMGKEMFEHQLLGVDLMDDSRWNFGEWTGEKFDFQWFGMDFLSISRHIRNCNEENNKIYEELKPDQQKQETANVEFMKARYHRK